MELIQVILSSIKNLGAKIVFVKRSLAIFILLFSFLPTKAFIFSPMQEIKFDSSDPELVLSLEENKKYRIKFYDFVTKAKQAKLIPSPNISDAVDIRTGVKNISEIEDKDLMGLKRSYTFHVIKVKKPYRPLAGTLNLVDRYGNIIETIRVIIKKRLKCDSKLKVKRCGYISINNFDYKMTFANKCEAVRAGAKPTKCGL